MGTSILGEDKRALRAAIRAKCVVKRGHWVPQVVRLCFNGKLLGFPRAAAYVAYGIDTVQAQEAAVSRCGRECCNPAHIELVPRAVANRARTLKGYETRRQKACEERETAPPPKPRVRVRHDSDFESAASSRPDVCGHPIRPESRVTPLGMWPARAHCCACGATVIRDSIEEQWRVEEIHLADEDRAEFAGVFR